MAGVPKVLVVDDAPDIVRLTRDYLEHAGFVVLSAANGDDALRLARTERPDLIVLDLGLPGRDGLDVTRELRRDSTVPIVMLTARTEESDKLVGLELGADDYVTKPFSAKELVARVRAVLRRSQAASEPVERIDAGPVEIDVARMRVTVDGRVVDLTPTEFELLSTMASQPGRVFTRAQLLDAVHGEAFEAYERAIDAHVKNIRRKIEPDPRSPRLIETVFGVGYRFAETGMSSSSGEGRPKRRPPWWPDNEEWPPADWGGRWGGGRWGGRQSHGQWGPRRRPFGCFLIVFLLFAAATLTAAVWAVAALLGVVSAPPIVVVGGLIVTVVVALGAIGMFRFVRGSSATIDSLAVAAERVERGDYSTRVDVSGPPPVRSLARAFNQMSARLATLESGRRSFLADVAHELRTPLSIIEGQIEAIEDGIYPADAEHLAPIHDQIRALEKLIDDMRTVALAEAGGLTLTLKPTDLRVLIDESLAGFNAQADGAGVSLRADVPTSLPLAMADEQRVRQILSNLMINAVRHTPRDGTVTVSARPSATGWLEIRLADTGSGIAPELVPTIFDRFVKEPESPGSGLGLAICRDLVEAHGGQISIDSRQGVGTAVTFTLPMAPGTG